MTSAPANAQAHKMLQTLCKFIIPIVQTLRGQAMMSADNIPLGPEAYEFVAELEKFVHALGIRSQQMTKAVEAKRRPLKDPVDYFEEIKWFWKLPEDSVTLHASTSIKYTLTRSSRLQDDLQKLHNNVIDSAPIRLLHFEPNGSALKITLVDRNTIYHRLAEKLHSMNSTRSRKLLAQQRISYAILSHTWNQTAGELTYRNWQSGYIDADDPKVQKIINFCRVAWEQHGLSYGWIDTVCINKDSSSELDESIRSMYRWYSKAQVCITYLADTHSVLDASQDPWFTRGWTLQELVAPTSIKFYNTHWERLVETADNDIRSPLILEAIERATTITSDELGDLHSASISRRMELAAKRKVTREEDAAYSLMGIFDVSISTAYGEGVYRAFFRLLKEIFETTINVCDIFNWGGRSQTTTTTSLFPSESSFYLDRAKHFPSWNPIQPLMLTHLGLRIPLLLMPAALSWILVDAYEPVGEYHGSVTVYRYDETLDYEEDRGQEETYYLLADNDDSLRNAMGTFNIEMDDSGNGTNIRVPMTCFAVLLERMGEGFYHNSARYTRKQTKKPISFTLEKTSERDEDGNGSKNYYVIDKEELEAHGMKLATLYL